jgi:hypothetical protein
MRLRHAGEELTPRLNHPPLEAFTSTPCLYSLLASSRSPCSSAAVPCSRSSIERASVGSSAVELSAAELAKRLLMEGKELRDVEATELIGRIVARQEGRDADCRAGRTARVAIRILRGMLAMILFSFRVFQNVRCLLYFPHECRGTVQYLLGTEVKATKVMKETARF